jgi:hypothetical protein
MFAGSPSTKSQMELGKMTRITLRVSARALEQAGSRDTETSFTPNGFVSIHEALSRLGRARFPSEWTGEEHRARTGLMSVEEASRPGTGSSGGGMRMGGMIRERSSNIPVPAQAARATTERSRLTNPYDPSYQAEYRAAQRFEIVSHELRVLLEAGKLEAVILDSWSGRLHPVHVPVWRQHDANQMIKLGQAQIPPDRNTGSLLVKEFTIDSAPSKAPPPKAKIAEAVAALQKTIATESLTRPQQKQFLRDLYPEYHWTERALNQTCQGVPVRKGRRRKSNTKA